MRKARWFQFLWLLFPIGLISFTCTENPFGSDKISGTGVQLRGTVRLSSGQTHAGIYVWLEGFDIGTYTDSEGKFSLSISASNTQGGKVSGVYSLYYYMANYRLDSSEVVIEKGKIKSFSGDFNHDGELDKPVILGKILTVKTTLFPHAISYANPRQFVARITLEAIASPVKVYYPGVVDGRLLPLIFRNITTGATVTIETTLVGVSGTDTLTVTNGNPYVRQVVVNPGRGAELPVGQYEVIPYLLVLSPTVPTQLLKSIVQGEIPKLSEYLKIPFLREGDHLTVSE